VALSPNVSLSVAVPDKEAVLSTTSCGTTEEQQLFHEECTELFNHFNHRCLDAILRATKGSLDLIRKRVFLQKYVYFTK
jgi:hypothetical protein